MVASAEMQKKTVVKRKEKKINREGVRNWNKSIKEQSVAVLISSNFNNRTKSFQYKLQGKLQSREQKTCIKAQKILL